MARSFRAAAVFVVLASAANAQPRLARGAHELALHVSPDFESAIGDTLTVDAGYGIFLRDRLQVRATVGRIVMEDIAGEDSDYRRTDFDLVGEYHFRGWGALVPYAGASAGWTRSQFNRLDESAFVYGPRGGIKYFVAGNVALTFEVTYRLGTAEVFINDFVAEDADLGSSIGLRVLF